MGHNLDFSKTLSNETIYPMPVFCLLLVRDVQQAAEWYEKALEFRVIFSISDPATQELSFVHLRRAKYQDILLRKGLSNKEHNAYGIQITFQAWTDIDVLTNKAKAYQATVIQEPSDTLWQTRDVTFQDLDGYHITFTYPNESLRQQMADQDSHLLDKKAWEE